MAGLHGTRKKRDSRSTSRFGSGYAPGLLDASPSHPPPGGGAPTSRKAPRFRPLNPCRRLAVAVLRVAGSKHARTAVGHGRRLQVAGTGSRVATTARKPRMGTMNQRLKTQRFGADKDGLWNLCPPLIFGNLGVTGVCTTLAHTGAPCSPKHRRHRRKSAEGGAESGACLSELPEQQARVKPQAGHHAEFSSTASSPTKTPSCA